MRLFEFHQPVFEKVVSAGLSSLGILADSGFFKNFLYQGGVKSTVSWVFEDLKFKISEGYDQNWCFPDSAQLGLRQLTEQSQENTNFGPILLKF